MMSVNSSLKRVSFCMLIAVFSLATADAASAQDGGFYYVGSVNQRTADSLNKQVGFELVSANTSYQIDLFFPDGQSRKFSHVFTMVLDGGFAIRGSANIDRSGNVKVVESWLITYPQYEPLFDLDGRYTIYVSTALE
ncbi:MAG: hypothetical protein KDA78_11015 [Planctomycetaceae bacterium]|nr:hypothetical protein [Planctomycetaceae bacterium]